MKPLIFPLVNTITLHITNVVVEESYRAKVERQIRAQGQRTHLGA